VGRMNEAAARLPDRLATVASASDPGKARLVRHTTTWTLEAGGKAAVLRHTKGLAYLAALLRAPGVERHVLDLVDLVEGVPVERGLDRRRLGDAGAMLDQRAKAAYRRRLEQPREQRGQADAVEDDARMMAIQDEIDALVAELSRAVGLGGRDRHAGSIAERARLNVTRANRAAIARIEQVLPEVSADLRRGVRTGTYCSYRPEPDGTSWGVATASQR
jgi:hypothetical protein